MRAGEFILEKLSDTIIFEMAHYQRDAKKIVTGFSPQIFEHLVKIQVLNSSEERVNYWINEIHNKWLKIIDDITLKPKNKRVSYDLLVKWMIHDAGPTYDLSYLNKVIQRLEKEFNTSVKNIDREVILMTTLEIMKEVCKQIANNDYIYLTLEN